MKKIRYVIIVGIFLLLVSCRDHEFLNFKNDTDILQICIKPFGVLKGINTGDNGGMEILQLFDTNFDLLEEVPLYTTIPFRISNWQNGIIDIQLSVNNAEEFDYWFINNKYKPLKIGKYKIDYSYRISKGGLRPRDVNIDSISFHKKDIEAMFYSNGGLINGVALDSLYIAKLEIVHVDHKTKIAINYYPLNGSATEKLLEDITKIYDK